MNNVEFLRISMSDSLKPTSGHLHAAHCLLYHRSKWNGHDCKFVLMQMRFDGRLGFPGGLVDDDVVTKENIVGALNRELVEEINYASKPIQSTDYLFSHIFDKPTPEDPALKLVTHFYARKLTEAEFVQIESHHTKALHFPTESLGLFRIPILDTPNILSDKFMSNFLSNTFAGNAKDQLLSALAVIRD